MRERLLHGRFRQLGVRPTPERAARAGQDHALHVLAPLAAQALRQARVLRVHGDQALGLALDEVGHELAAHDQALLVRERERLARLQRREGRPEPRRADERVQHHVSLGIAGEPLRRVGADEDLGSVDPAQLPAELGGGLFVGHRDEGRQELADLTDQQLLVRPGRQPDDLEPVRVATDDVQRLRPDRSRGAEDHERTHGARVPCPAAEHGNRRSLLGLLGPHRRAA